MVQPVKSSFAKAGIQGIPAFSGATTSLSDEDSKTAVKVGAYSWGVFFDVY